MVHRFNIKKAAALDSPERLEFLNPNRILGMLGLENNMTFADFGCGTGYFSIPASGMVNKVYAIDVQQGMLDILNGKIKKDNAENIEPILSDGKSIPLHDGVSDIIFMANVFHEIDDLDYMLTEVKRVLSKQGKLVIIDWKKMEMDMGPPLSERLSLEEVILICGNSGFENEINMDAGPYNYMLVFGVNE